MPTLATLTLLILVGIIGGAIAGAGGPGGIPVLLGLNLMLSLSPSASAATASSIFVIATVTATGLYQYSDGIDIRLSIFVGFPALIGTYAGTYISNEISIAVFELILGVVLLVVAAAIIYQQLRSSTGVASDQNEQPWRTTSKAIASGSLLIGILSGVTGLGGPALTIPLMIVFNVVPVVAIGAGLASGILITANSVVGHIVQGNAPAVIPFISVGIPYVLSQIIGWKYVHSVSEKAISYTIAAITIVGAFFFIF